MNSSSRSSCAWRRNRWPISRDGTVWNTRRKVNPDAEMTCTQVSSKSLAWRTGFGDSSFR